ncbi:MAG: ATP-binding cassette domain-containing protein [Firmicutes bacterium]|nr:ATP-binding cassette domain-containing protein [Bacillota bacterium]
MKIEIKDATKYIRKALILNHVSVSLQSGKIYGLQGPNGSGKTMLLRLISGLIKPTSGHVLIDDKELGIDMDFPPSMGILIEAPAFIDAYTGLRNLELLADIKQVIQKDQIIQTLQKIGLDPNDRRKYYKYSLGMKQRLGIAAAIMEQPALLLLDEPTNALDEVGVALICNIILKEKERGALIVIASHDGLFLRSLADELYYVTEGKVEKRNVCEEES